MTPVQHVVLFKIKPHVTSIHIVEIFERIANLQNLIPGIQAFEGGEYFSEGNLNHGYTHGFVMTFESVEARDAYLPHPEHKKVEAILIEAIDGILGFDFKVGVPFNR
jgi:hypothetical protein